jgi:hypothetical protein
MPRHLLTICSTFLVSVSVAQNSNTVSTYILGQYNKPFLEWGQNSNAWGLGLGAETFFMTNRKLQPTIDLAGNVFIKKAEFSQPFGSTEKAADIKSNISLLAGVSLHPIRRLYLSFVAGPTLINSKVYFSGKPSLGFYIDKERKWTMKVSALTIYRYVPVKPVFEVTPDKETTGYLQVSIGRRIF